jgi:transglutaminase-like putative cysteine protease
MPRVSIRHLTAYRYRNPVALGEHRMMLRPRESCDQRLVSAALAITPEPSSLHNVHDLFGNGVSIARFVGRTDRLTVESRVTLDHEPQAPVALASEPWPVAYSPDDLPDLRPSIELRHADPAGELAGWARRFVGGARRTRLAALLGDMTQAIHGEFAYVTRLSGAPQPPLETLALRTGSCRDFAVLMIEAARSLGFAARFVSGYVHSTSADRSRTGGGHTHAWVAVYLPDVGWVDFDPTNGSVGAVGLIRLVVARDPTQALPLHGTWAGLPADYLGMDVEVEVSAEPGAGSQPAPLRRVAQG